MMSRSAIPTGDCVFSDPTKHGVLKLHNAAPWGQNAIAGGIAVYNLTDREQGFAFSPAEIPELDTAQSCWVYDYFTGTVCSLGREERYEGTAAREGYSWFVILPKSGLCSCLGLVDKYAGFSAVESYVESGHKAIAVIHESGKLGWLADREPQTVFADGKNVTDLVSRNGNLYTAALPERSGKIILEIQF